MEKVSVVPFLSGLLSLGTIQFLHFLVEGRKRLGILKEQGLPTLGSKDELAMRCYLKLNSKEDFISRKEVEYLLKIVVLSKEVVTQEKRLLLLGFEDAMTVRKYFTDFPKAKLMKLDNADMEEIFMPLEMFLKSYVSPEILTNVKEPSANTNDEECDPYETFFQVGTKVKILWQKDVVENLGWRGGWYVAYVTDFSREEDQISVHQVSERGQIYTIEVTSALAAKELKLA